MRKPGTQATPFKEALTLGCPPCACLPRESATLNGVSWGLSGPSLVLASAREGFLKEETAKLKLKQELVRKMNGSLPGRDGRKNLLDRSLSKHAELKGTHDTKEAGIREARWEGLDDSQGSSELLKF